MAKNRDEWTAIRKRQWWRKCCCDSKPAECRDCLWAVVVLLITVGVVMWMFYGFFCMMECGMYPTQCVVSQITVDVKVCQSYQDDDFRYYPYTGLVTWCFNAQTPKRGPPALLSVSTRDVFKKKGPRGDEVLCTVIKASCTDNPATAFQKINSTTPIGTAKDCWYGFSSLDNEDYTRFYLDWKAPVDMATWFTVNKYFGIGAASLVAALLILIFCRECILHRLEKHQYQDYRSEKSETEPLAPVV